ncbi:preprotein translocase subunit SecE [Verrucomicrobiota bacterium]
MESLQKKIQGIKAFFNDVLGEMRKCTWPEKQELIESTVVVIALLFMLSTYVGICDKVLVVLLRALIPSG